MHTIITHNGSFHTDDVFAVATLQLLLGVDNCQVVRTRDEEVIAGGEYVVDVGAVYDHAQKRYDHHQPDAPVRENGLPYSAFGLVWRHYGSEVCDSEAAADAIDQQLVQPVDAGDNGISLFELNEWQLAPVELYQIIGSYAPVWNSDGDKDAAFLEAVAWARGFLERTIARKRAGVEMEQLVQETYEAAADKRILEFSVPVSARALIQYEDVLAVVHPDDFNTESNWKVSAVNTQEGVFTTRASFPESWAGLRGEGLAAASGISDAVFCHKNRHLFIAASRDSARAATTHLTTT